MPIVRRTDCIKPRVVLAWMCWLRLCGFGTRAMLFKCISGYRQTSHFFIFIRSIFSYYHYIRLFQWPRGLKRRSSAARLLRLWVRIPSGAWMFVSCECCVLSLRRTDHSSRGVLLTVARRCVWSKNLENEEAKARYRAVIIQSQWVVTPGKQTNNTTISRPTHGTKKFLSSGYRRFFYGHWSQSEQFYIHLYYKVQLHSIYYLVMY